MKNGYDQFFKQARKAAPKGTAIKHSELTQEIEKQLRKKVGAKTKKVRKSPWKMILVSFLGIPLCIAGISEHERLEKMLQSVEISLLGQAQAEDKNPPAEHADKKEDKQKEESKKEEKKPSSELATDNGDINHLQKLVERKKQLDDRESELTRTEEEIVKQKEEIEKRMKELEDMRSKISTVLEDKVKIDEQKVDSLTQMYSSMKPPQAAKVFENMDEDLAVEILGRMKKKNAADVLNLLKPEKAQAISEKYAGYRRQPAALKSETTTNNNKDVKP